MFQSKIEYHCKENSIILTKEFEDSLGSITIGSVVIGGRAGGDSGESVVECTTESSELEELEVFVVDSKSCRLEKKEELKTQCI